MQLIQTRPNRGLPNGKVVFGLSTSHFRNLTWKWKQARQRDVSLWYHCDFWPSSLAQEPESHLCPLLSVRSFTSIQMLHTHTLLQDGGKIKVWTMKWKWRRREMKMRWKENEMKVTYPGREEGNAKEEGRRKHQHMKPSPKRANPGKAREKKSEGRRTRNKTSGGGGGRTPEPTYHSETYTYLGTRRTQPTWREENARTHEIRDPWGTSWWRCIHINMQIPLVAGSRA